MPLNPVAREEFILDCMANIAGGIVADQTLLDRITRTIQYSNNPDASREERAAELAYEFAVALADRYDLENP